MSYEIASDNNLYHWGIKGQKWGFRRWQNDDGTLTSAGKVRYGTKSDGYNSNDVQNRLLKKSGVKTDGYSKQKMPGKVTNLSEDEIKKQKQKNIIKYISSYASRNRIWYNNGNP